MGFVACLVVISVLLSFVSGLILPMKKTNGDPDMDSVINHVTTMEQTITSLQAQVLAGNAELVTLKEELKSSNDEISAVKATLKLAETDITILKNNQQRSPNPAEFAQLKTELEALKVSHNVLVQQINLTVIDAVSADVMTNKREIKSLKSELITIEIQVNKTSSDFIFKRAEAAYLTKQVLFMNAKLNQSIQTAVSNKVDIAILKSQMTDVSKSINTTTSTIHSLETQITLVETEYNSLRSIQNITEQQVAKYKVTGQSTTADLKTAQTQVHTVANFTSEVSTLNTQINQSIYDILSNNADIAILKSQLTDVTESIKTAGNNIHLLETQLASADSQYKSLGSRQNMTEHEVAEWKALVQATAGGLRTVQTDVSGLREELTVARNTTNKDVAFQITQRGSSSIDWTTLKFDTIDYNTGHGYNMTTGIFTAPVSGTYMFWVNVVLYKTAGNHFIYIYKGSSLIAIGLGRVDDAADYGIASTTTTAHLDEGDHVYFTTDSTSNYISSFGGSSYGGSLIHASL